MLAPLTMGWPYGTGHRPPVFKKATMKAHPLADTYPMAEDDIPELSESIKAIGQLHPIITFDGMILDGRRRHEACKLAKIEPNTREYRGKSDWASLVRFVQGANDLRRHLSTSQRAVVAFKMTKLAADNGDPKCANLRKSQAEAAEVLGVSGRSVVSASKVVQNAAAPIIKAVEAGEVKVSDAAAIANLPKAEQTAALNAVRSGEASTLREAAASGEPESVTIEDSVGQVVPAKLEGVFSDKQFDKQQRALGAVKSWAKKLGDTPAASYLHLQSFVAAITELQKQLKFESPYAVCPYCQAKKPKCEACKGRGFVTKPIYDGAPSELRV